MSTSPQFTEPRTDKGRGLLEVLSGWLPTKGNVVFTVIVVAVTLTLGRVGAAGLLQSSPSVPKLINYQGRLLKPDGSVVADGTYRMTFALHCQDSGLASFWSETRDGANKVPVSNGLFSVTMGGLDQIGNPLPSSFSCSPVFLGVTVEGEELTPRERLTSSPYALQADVPDGSISTMKLADASVTTQKVADGAITLQKLAPNAIPSPQFQPLFQSVHLEDQPSTTSTSWQDIPGTLLTLSVDSNQQILIWGQTRIFQLEDDLFPWVRLIANGTQVIAASADHGNTPGGRHEHTTVSVMGTYQATPGTLVIKMQFRSGAVGLHTNVADRNLFALGVGR